MTRTTLEGARRRLTPRRRTVLVACTYAALAIAFFQPQMGRPQDTVQYIGDPLESVYIVAWNVHQAFRDPLRLFDANVLYPTPHSLALTDHRLLPSLLVAPVVWATRNPVLAFNVALLLGSLLASLACYRLARLLDLGTLAAWTAGALYAFHTYQINEAPRLNIFFHGFIPLALGELLLYLKTGARRRAWSAAGLMLLQGLSSNYHLLYGSLLVLLVVALGILKAPRRVLPKLPGLALAASVAAAAYLPVALVYLEVARHEGFARELPAGIDLRLFLATQPTNLLYGPIWGPVRSQQRAAHFVGFVSMALAALALAGIFRTRRDETTGVVPARLWVPAAAALALLLAALALGREVVAFGHAIGPGPYRLLFDWVPGFHLVRIPERLTLLAMLFVALLVGRGIELVRRRAVWLAVLLAVLVPLEHFGSLPSTTRVRPLAERPRVYDWLSRNPVIAYAEVPSRGEGLIRKETLEMYFSIGSFPRTIEGYTAYPPLLSRLLRRAADQFPSDGSLQVLRRVGVDTVVVHHGRRPGWDLWHRLTSIGRERDYPRLLQAADLDVYHRLPDAVSAGRIRLLARFAGAEARLFESSADEVYRIAPAAAQPAAAFPTGRRLRGPEWRYRTKRGDPGPAADGDLGTDWVVSGPLRGDEFFEVTFPRPVAVSGLVLPLQRDSVFPTRFRIGALSTQGQWGDVARLDTAHTLQLVDQLMRGQHPALGFDLGGREILGLIIMVSDEGTSFAGWRIPEIEVWTTR